MMLRLAVVAVLAALVLIFGVPTKAESHGEGIHSGAWTMSTTGGRR